MKVATAVSTLALVAALGVSVSLKAPPAAPDPVKVLRIDASSPGVSIIRPWATLRDVLPNVTYAYEYAGKRELEQITDSVAVGRVIRTEPARGMLGESLVAGEDARTRVVDFDDPRAAWRILTATLEVSETLAGPHSTMLVFDWYLPGPTGTGPDAGVIGRALEDLGTVVLLSKAFPMAPEFVPGRGPLPYGYGGYGIGRVATDDLLSFPLILQDEHPQASEFQDGIDTLTELRAEARKPVRTESMPRAGG